MSVPLAAQRDSPVFTDCSNSLYVHMLNIPFSICRGFANITEKVIWNRRDFTRSLKALELIQKQMKDVRV